MTMAIHGWPLVGSPTPMRLKPPFCPYWTLYQTKWMTRRHTMASKPDVKAEIAPTGYETFLRQQKHERSIAEKNNQALILDILGASATRRDARGYLQRFGPQQPAKRPSTIPSPFSNIAGLNLGRLFGPSQLAENGKRKDATVQNVDETLHVALVKIRDPQSIDDTTLRGVMHTLEQLSHLGMQIVVVVDCEDETVRKDSLQVRNLTAEQVDRIVNAVGIMDGVGARKLDSVFRFTSESSGQQIKAHLTVQDRNLLLSPLRRGKMCVIAPNAFNPNSTMNQPVSGNDILLALTREFVGISAMQQQDDDDNKLAHKIQSLQSEVSLDRVIVLDPLGGIPHDGYDRAHRYINLEQEFDELMGAFSNSSNLESIRHTENLSLMKSTLMLLPSSSSGFITTPSAVAKEDTNSQHDSGPDPPIGTRSQRNLLIHNLLTNKPAVSFSLPQHRQDIPSTSTPSNVSTLLKRGMSLTVIPSIPPSGWTCPSPHPHLGTWTSPVKHGLRKPAIDYQRLTYLINDSFGRTLDVKSYDTRTRTTLAGLIIAGDYDGAAIFTWELPPPSFNLATAPNHPWVPYLDKFAVLRSAQGTATADVLWNAMSEAFPQGFCWRSRTVNPVNKWYFERSQGSLKLGGTEWTMFWSRKGILNEGDGGRDWRGFLGVCGSVKPSWMDSRAVD